MKIIPISISKTGGPVSVTVAITNVPLSIGGVVWRYNADQSADGSAGKLVATPATIPLGGPANVDQKIFLIEGGVAHPDDKRTVAYQLIVSISQDGRELHAEVPENGGAGKIGDTDLAFLYCFQLIAS